MKVHWTPEARAQLKAIEAYIAKESPAAAERTVGRIAKRAGQAGDFPYSGRKVPEFSREELRELPEHPYRIIYRVRSKQVDVVTIWHVRRLLPGNLF